jgi:folate-binding protein YgfZ
MGQTPPLVENERTPLAALGVTPDLQMHLGRLTPRSFEDCSTELGHLMHSAAIYDLGYLTRIRITGKDRVRWLNGMVTNNTRDMAEGTGLYSFVLNAQGRIQGDGWVFRSPDHYIFETDRQQSPRLLAHLDHFIIMDDVELQELDAADTTLGLAGPEAPALLESLGVEIPEEMAFAQTSIQGIPVTLVNAWRVLVPRFELWLAAEHTKEIWQALTSAGAKPAGSAALDALRIYEGTPQYGTDITDRSLPQETNQMRALNFNKGCYLGQEIVERIRSRATVHRTLQQFALDGKLPPPGTQLYAEGDDKPIGEITSASHYALPGFTQALGLGFVRVEVLERKARITYAGGTATPLAAPLALP